MNPGRGARSTGSASRGQWRQRSKEHCQIKIKSQEIEKEKPHRVLKENIPKGTCKTMCPTRELQNRETQNCLHPFEMVPGTEKNRRPKGDPLRAVKKYSRPAAGKDATNPADLRPQSVLLETVCYLVDGIVASHNHHPWTEVYNFVFDRLRSVKQDMIIQRISGLDCVAILERIVRFHIYASYRLCGEPLQLYDPCINDTHLQEYLSWLLDCYASGKEAHPNQEEFYTLNLLFNLGSLHAMQHVMELPEQLRSTSSIALALSLNQAFQEKNFVRLFRLAQKLNFLQTCALHRHLVACGRDLLLIYSHGFNSRNCRFPLNRLAELLSLDTTLTSQLCKMYSLDVVQDGQVVFSKAAFTEPEQGRLDCKLYHSIVSKKQKDLTVENMIHGFS